MAIITDLEHYRDRGPTAKMYTLAALKTIAQEYCDDATSEARLDDRLRLSLFLQWLARREKEVEDASNRRRS